MTKHSMITVGIYLTMMVAPAAGSESTILMIGKKPDHPFGTHMYLHTCEVLSKCLRKHDPQLKVVISTGWPQDRGVLEDVKTVVVYSSPGAEFLLDSPARDQLDALMKRGVGIVTIHWASSVYKDNFDRLGPRWLSYLGGTWISNVGLHTGKSKLKQLLPTHPVCNGWSEYEIHDEYYLNPTITDADELLQVNANGKPTCVGWVFQRQDGGRAFGTTLGHFYRNFQKEPFRKMIINGIVWTAGLDVPAGGVDVSIPDSDLALPPKP